MRLRYGRHCAHYLTLGDFVNRVDVIHHFDSVQVSLMHRVDSDVARPSFWLRLTPFTDSHLYGMCFGIVHSALAVTPALSQVVNVRHRDRRQPLVLGVSVELPFPFQNLLGRRSAHRLVRFIHLGQQFQVCRREETLKSVAPVVGFLHLAVFHVSAYQSRHLCATPSRHLFHFAPQQPPPHLALRSITLLSQQPRNPLIHLPPPFALKVNFLAGFQKRPQAQFLPILHADDQFLACAPLP